MLETSYSKSVANSRRERRDMLKALSVLPECCGNCAFYDGGFRGVGHCLHPKNASVRWTDGNNYADLAPVTVTQGCELFDRHKVTIRDADETVETELAAIQAKYTARRA